MNRIFEFIFLISYCSNLSRSSMFDCTQTLIETRVSIVIRMSSCFSRKTT